MESVVRLTVHSERETEAVGARLASVASPGMSIFLRGELGAGKTTLVRGLLRHLGVGGAVKSPTYTLVEPYRTASLPVHHFDLYRVRDPQELEDIGIRDYFSGDALCLVEWPERGGAFLPEPDLTVQLHHLAAGNERLIEVSAHAQPGARLLVALAGLNQV